MSLPHLGLSARVHPHKEALSLDSTSTVFTENGDGCWGGRHPPPLPTQQGQSTGRSQGPLSHPAEPPVCPQNSTLSSL